MMLHIIAKRIQYTIYNTICNTGSTSSIGCRIPGLFIVKIIAASLKISNYLRASISFVGYTNSKGSPSTSVVLSAVPTSVLPPAIASASAFAAASISS